MFQEGIWFNVYLKGHKYNYIGQVSYIEENQRNPHVLLINYSMYDVDTGRKIELVKRENEKRSIILELKDIDYVETIEN